MAKCIKSVSFNEKNEKDVLILKHVKRRNFSGYVKKLILQDMALNQTENVNEVVLDTSIKTKGSPILKQEEEPKKLTNAERLEKLKKQTKMQQTPQNPLPFMPNQPKR